MVIKNCKTEIASVFNYQTGNFIKFDTIDMHPGEISEICFLLLTISHVDYRENLFSNNAMEHSTTVPVEIVNPTLFVSLSADCTWACWQSCGVLVERGVGVLTHRGRRWFFCPAR